MKITEKYITVNETIKLHVYVEYDMGSQYYGRSTRGYYLCVNPITVENRGGYYVTSYIAYTGVKDLLLAVSRKSKKSEKQALALAREREQVLVDYVCRKQGLALPKEVN